MRTTFDETMKGALPEEKLAEMWQGLAGKLGDYEKVTDVRHVVKGDFVSVIVSCKFLKDRVGIQVSYDASGKVAGIHFVAAQGEQDTAPSTDAEAAL